MAKETVASLSAKIDALVGVVETLATQPSAASEVKAETAAPQQSQHLTLTNDDGEAVAFVKRYQGTKQSFVVVSTNATPDGLPRPSQPKNGKPAASGWYKAAMIPEDSFAVLAANIPAIQAHLSS